MKSVRSKILGSCKRPGTPEKVKTPEWDTPHVFVRTLRGKDVSHVLKVLDSNDSKEISEEAAMGKLNVMFVCDAQGAPLFIKDDIPALLLGPLAPLQRCMRRGLRLNGLDNESQEELRGNSNGALGSERGTGSHDKGANRSAKSNKKRTAASS